MPSIVPSRAGDDISPDIFRQLFVSLDLPADTHPVIGITSAIAGEGRTTVAVGLARTLAQDLEAIVTLVDVDLEKPSLAGRFDLAADPGLTAVLRGHTQLADVRSLVAPNLCVVTAGESRAEATSLLRQLPVNDPFHGLQGLRGVVILDLPPILNHAYSSMATQVADAIVLVVRAGVTPVDVVREAIARLEDRPPRGVVFNGFRSGRSSRPSDKGQ